MELFLSLSPSLSTSPSLTRSLSIRSCFYFPISLVAWFLFYFCSSIELIGTLVMGCPLPVGRQEITQPAKPQLTHTRTPTFTLPPRALARFQQDKIRTGLCHVKLTNTQNTWRNSKRVRRQPIVVECSDGIMHEPWAEGLAEHTPSTATRNARMHTYTCTNAHGRILSCWYCFFFFMHVNGLTLKLIWPPGSLKWKQKKMTKTWRD